MALVSRLLEEAWAAAGVGQKTQSGFLYSDLFFRYISPVHTRRLCNRGQKLRKPRHDHEFAVAGHRVP